MGMVEESARERETGRNGREKTGREGKIKRERKKMRARKSKASWRKKEEKE